MPDGPPDPRPPRWPWALFLASAAWAVVVRVPLVLNARAHLDSDLAVDGLTLLDAVHGRWRWHYPGTPHMGIGPVLLSWPQAAVWGASPESLVSGGVVAHLGLLLAVFLLTFRAFGPWAACGSLLPLTFASGGLVWLSGRVTGGHLVDAAWNAGAFALLAGCLQRGGRRRSATLGLWCGFGLALDSLFLTTLAGLVPAAVVGWLAGGAPRRGLASAAVFVGAFVVGVLPRPVGAWVDPYDAYREQFSVVTTPELLAGHARILGLDCLPRLLAGHRLPGLESEPDPLALTGPGVSTRRGPFDLVAVGVVALQSLVLLASVAALARACFRPNLSAGNVVALGLGITSAVTVAGFLTNRNIFNSDNYRYLVPLLAPWAVGVGLVVDRLRRSGNGGRLVLVGVLVVSAGLMTWDLARWYARFGWVDPRGRPVRARPADPVLDWLDGRPDVAWVDGGYWDVYRIAFLTGGRVRGAPFPVYPNRFPDWRPSAGVRRVTLVRPTPEGLAFRAAALRAGGRVVFQGRGVAVIAAP